MGPTVAIVGPRKALEYGVQIAGELAHDLVARGICVVSGLAYGIDGAAHAAALKAGGRTVAVRSSPNFPSEPNPIGGRFRGATALSAV